MRDDFSTNPAKWSWEKLKREFPHGMPAVVKEYEIRTVQVRR